VCTCACVCMCVCVFGVCMCMCVGVRGCVRVCRFMDSSRLTVGLTFSCDHQYSVIEVRVYPLNLRNLRVCR